MNERARKAAHSAAQYQVRPARASDAAGLCAAERETARIPGRLVSLPDELEPAAFARRIDELAAAGSYLVVESDNGIVAHGLLEPVGPLAALAHIRTLTIVVHSGHTGQGIGHVLMQSLLDWARAQPGVEKVELRVRATNAAAVHLYTKFGFVEEGRLRRRVKLADTGYVDDITMAWFAPTSGGRIS
jgi:RimJ/RimL family protein N-acetyltransferase